MKLEGEGKLLRIFIGESDKHGRKPLYQAIVEMLREEGMAGATVLRGIEGFGANSHLHTARILRLSEDLPIVIEVADPAERIEAIMPKLDEMVTEGMVTLERVEVVTYRAQATREEAQLGVHGSATCGAPAAEQHFRAGREKPGDAGENAGSGATPIKPEQEGSMHRRTIVILFGLLAAVLW